MTERHAGILSTWKGAYGFLKPDDGARDCFVSAREMRAAGIDEPVEGQRFVWSVGASPQDGRSQAIEVSPEAADAAARKVFNPIRQE
jgi:cold shock CspA family protein